jgi:hypothetical protein
MDEHKRSDRGTGGGDHMALHPALLGFAALLLEIAAGKEVSQPKKDIGIGGTESLAPEVGTPKGCSRSRAESRKDELQ